MHFPYYIAIFTDCRHAGGFIRRITKLIIMWYFICNTGSCSVKISAAEKGQVFHRYEEGKKMTRIGRINGTVLTSLLLVILGTLSCSKGYNKYAEEHYAQGKIFYENMEYGRSIDSFSKVLELAPAGEENNRI